MAGTSLAHFLLVARYYSQPAIYMKSIKSMALVAALASGFALSASAGMPLSTVNVPDNGATVMFLGVALAGLALMRHYLKR